MNVFLSCVSQKASHRCKARDMYTSPMFKKSLKYAEQLKPDRMYILSAKYHLLSLDKEIEPYNTTLLDLKQDKRKEWAEEVLKEMRAAHIDFNAKTYFLAGEKYTEFLLEYFPNSVEVYKDKQVGEIMHWLDGHTKQTDEDVDHRSMSPLYEYLIQNDYIGSPNHIDEE